MTLDIQRVTIMKRILLILSVIFLSSCTTTDTTLEYILNKYDAEPYQLKLKDVKDKQWYMGTQTGFDSNLIFIDKNNLIIEDGGCFHHGPVFKSEFTITDKGVHIDNEKLRDHIGAVLYTIKIKGHIVFIPEKQLNRIKKQGPQLPISYWPLYEESGIPHIDIPKF